MKLHIATFSQPDLPYAYNALDPDIDPLTVALHYLRHHAAYTGNLNEALQALAIPAASIEDILKTVSKYPTTIRNNGGGYYNHNLYWEIMSPHGGGVPSGKFSAAIRHDFGSFEAFKNIFSQMAISFFGSGWIWLISNNGKLKITVTPNQDNPLMDVVEEKGTPILCIDVWEHAYYLKYQHKRADYVHAFWNIVNWNRVSILYEKTVEGEKQQYAG